MSLCGFGRYKNESCFTPTERTCVIKAYNHLFGTQMTASEIEQDLHINWYEYLQLPEFFQITKHLCPKLVFAIFRLAFKPSLIDADGTGWLGNWDLDNLFDQVVHSPVGEDFVYLGTLTRDQPVDMPPDTFTRSWGAIINTDNTGEGGSHWVAAFCEYKPDVSQRVLEYFDSTGLSPVRDDPRRDMVWSLRRFAPYPIKYNSVRHQLDDKSCGIHSAAFVLQRVAGMSFQEIIKLERQDEVMQQFKKILWFEIEQV